MGMGRTAAAALALMALSASSSAGQGRTDAAVAERLQQQSLAQARWTMQQQAARVQAAERQRRQAEARAAQQREVDSWPEATETFSRTLRLGRNGTFDLQNVVGDVAITGGRGDDIRIDATKRVRHRALAQARAALAEVVIDVAERGGNVELRTEQPRRRAVWAAVDYTVRVPSGANVTVVTVSGNVRVSNVSGELRASAADGSVTAADVRRVRLISTMRGNVEVSNAESDELSATTLQGDVLLRNLKGRVLDLNTVTGDVRLVDVQMDRARLETTAGDIEYAGPLARSGRYEFHSHSGNIRITPSDGGFDLDANSFNGDVQTDYILKRLDDATARGRRGGPRTEQRSLRGTFGDAAAVLTARSFSGDILIVRR